jgi:hypothetical protein
MFFSLCFEGGTGTDESSRSKKLQDERRTANAFFSVKTIKRFAEIIMKEYRYDTKY